MRSTGKLGISTRLARLAVFSCAVVLAPETIASQTMLGGQALEQFDVAHCCHPHPVPPYDQHCCHPPSGTVYVAPTYVGPSYYGPAGVRGTARRTSRRTSRRVSRRR